MPSQLSKLSLSPAALSTVSDEPNDELAPIDAPSRSIYSASWMLFLVFVPSRSICAVTLAKPVIAAGSNKPPAPPTCSCTLT